MFLRPKRCDYSLRVTLLRTKVTAGLRVLKVLVLVALYQAAIFSERSGGHANTLGGVTKHIIMR